MNEWKKLLKRRLFGFHPAKTSDFIRKLLLFQEMETAELREKVSAWEKEYEWLRREATRLEAELEARRKREERAQAAVSRLDESKKAVRMLGEYEANAFREQAEKKAAEHRSSIERIEEQSRTYEETFQLLLGEVSDLIRKVESLHTAVPLKGFASEAGMSFAEAAASKVQLESKAGAEEAEPNPSMPALFELQEEELAALHNRAKVIQFKLRNIAERQTQEEAISHEQERGQEQALEQVQDSKREQERTKEAEGELEQERELAAASSWGTGASGAPLRLNVRKPETQRAAKRSPSTSSFWGDIDDYLNTGSEEAPFGDQADAFEEGTGSEFFDTPSHRSDETRKPATASPAEMEPVVERPPAASVKNSSPIESPALTTEIVAIRNRYIVGKLAGEALYGQDGRMIIGKNQKITSQVVQEADKEGKLPDLIIHMIVPAMSEGDNE